MNERNHFFKFVVSPGKDQKYWLLLRCPPKTANEGNQKNRMFCLSQTFTLSLVLLLFIDFTN